ncbi:P22 phage major capsid protein family protein [Gemmata sp. JC717]|uniref:P22 phage major capsid protein family protein n=1 Tax=Gemmata algarum TaxID=2975278 RepID=UPI0021BA5B0D|nr:P22 phage major capsid protein family protein [Gemmata algarum]MDY3551412.1 P22 phage major capsid protein family protein [Gemmata algarum]
MPNTLTGLIPTLYQALDVVNRELVGFIPAVSRDSGAERAALNQQILVPVTQAAAAIDNTPAVTVPDAGDQTVGNVAMTISKSRSVPIRWNGEEQRGMRNAGTYDSVLGNQFEQAFRTLVNEMENDLFLEAYRNGSRAVGTPGTAPFGTAGDISDAANVRQILDDNGCPQSNLKLVLGSAAVANLRGKQSILLRANENGSDAFRRSGAIAEVPLSGFMLHNSSAIRQITKGTGASYVTSGSTAAGVGSITLATGTGTVLAGDVVTFAADAANKYVVNTGVSAPGTIAIGAPGARVTIPTGNALTVGNNYTPNVAFHQSAIQLITRTPAMPMGPDGRPMDAAEDELLLTDPISGITFSVTVYRQFRQMSYLVGLAWGVRAIKPNNIALLQG